mmetsp:Transcript_55759/g.143686  ORF Transcript_55759/g.143686 Transcript_55759/m.143686 type:complete len:379 (+) Transcript_55759:62-1198(+)
MVHRDLLAREREEDLESCSCASSGDESSCSTLAASDSDDSPRSEVSPKTSRTPGVKCTAASARAIAVGAALGVLTLYAGIQVLAAPRPAEPGLPTDVTARMLLESRELAEVATEQLMAAGSGALRPEDRPMVHAVASNGFGNISALLQRGAPEAARRLDTFYLTKEQKEAVLGVVRGMGDRRVQGVGRELTSSLKHFLSTSATDRRSMKNYIVGNLQPQLGQMRQLRDEVIGAPLRNLREASRAGRRFGIALNPEELRVVSTYRDDWKWEFDMSPPVLAESRRLSQGDAPEHTKRMGVAGGIVEQAKVVIDQLKAMTGDAGMDMEVPAWVTTLDGNVKPFLSELFECVVDHMGNAEKVIACPMKFASAGIDLLAGVED